MPDPKVKVRITAEADPSLKQAFGAARSEMGALGGLVGNIKAQIAGLVSLVGVQQILRSGFSVNSMYQVAQRSLASVFMDNLPALRSVDAAFRQAGVAVDMLRRKANESSADFSDLLQSYSMNAGLLFRAGVGDLERQLELLTLIGDAAKSRGLTGPQLITELRALFTGNFGPDAVLANSFFATQADREQWRQALSGGRAYEVLRPRLESVALITERAAKDWDVVFSNFSEAVRTLTADLTRGAFVTFSEGLRSFTATLNSPETREWISGLIRELKAIVAVLAVMAGARAASGLASFARGMAARGLGAELAELPAFFAEFGKARTLWVGVTAALRPLIAAAIRLTAIFGALWGAIKVFQLATEMWSLKQARDAKSRAEENLGVSTGAWRSARERQIDEAVASGSMSPEEATRLKRRLSNAAQTGPEFLYAELRRQKPFASESMVAAPPALEVEESRRRQRDWMVEDRVGASWTTRGFLTRGEARAWDTQLRLLRNMDRYLGQLAAVVGRHLPTLAEEMI